MEHNERDRRQLTVEGRRQTISGERETGGASLVLRVALLLVLAAGLALAYGLGWHRYVTLGWLVDQREVLLDMVARHPVRAVVLFFAVYAAVVALSVPAASVLTIFAGFLFGWLTGGIIVVIAATIGSCLLFAGARTVFGDILKRRAGPFLKRFSEGFSRNAFSYLLVLRLAPMFPFSSSISHPPSSPSVCGPLRWPPWSASSRAHSPIPGLAAASRRPSAMRRTRADHCSCPIS